MIENLEMWIAIAALWATQIKILWDIREIKSVVKIEKKGKFI